MNFLFPKTKVVGTNVLDGTITSTCGILSLEMGVFGGIIVGLGVSFLHNRFYQIQLPSSFAFFAIPKATAAAKIIGKLLKNAFPTLVKIVKKLFKNVPFPKIVYSDYINDKFFICGNINVLSVAVYPKCNFCIRKGCFYIWVFWHFYLWGYKKIISSFWLTSCILFTVLANSYRRNNDCNTFVPTT